MTTTIETIAPPVPVLTLSTLARFLVGHREAIVTVARNTRAAWLGALFVLTAAFAREYDHVDLLSEPRHLAIPFAASLATSFVLFQMVWGVASVRDGQGIEFWPAYRSFLGLYWMTAPLAWLYAIPVERFLSPIEAAGANLWLLTIVSIWRVALITRVVSILFGSRWLRAFLVVMFFADTLVLVLLQFAGLPMFSIMGGMQLNESERLIAKVAFLVGTLAFLSWILWLIAALVVASTWTSPWRWAIDAPTAAPISRGAWSLSAGVLLVFLCVLPVTQSEHRLGARVDAELRAGRLEEAIDTMSEHEPADFPPDWDPPPRLGHREPTPALLDVLRTIIARDAPEWVWQKFLAKDEDRWAYLRFPPVEGEPVEDERITELIAQLDALPSKSRRQLRRRIEIAQQVVHSSAERHSTSAGDDPDINPLKERIKAWRDAASKP